MATFETAGIIRERRINEVAPMKWHMGFPFAFPTPFQDVLAWVLVLALACTASFWPASGQVPLSQPPQAQEREYRVNPGDELEVYIWGEERLQRAVKVLPDGTIAFPLVGQLIVAGDRPIDIEAKITEGLRPQYRGDVPQVTVSVVNPAGLQFTVMGKVNSPGTFTPGRYVNVLEALSMAGGPSDFASLDNILVLRREGTGWRTIYLNVRPLMRGRAEEGNIDLRSLAVVQTGDTIIVP
jgi:polysaccharide biosynthesis/export protein